MRRLDVLPARGARTDVVSLGYRMGYMQALRLSIAIIVLNSSLLSSRIITTSPEHLTGLTLAYLLLSGLTEVLRRRMTDRASSVVGASLLLDGVYLAWIIYLTGGTSSSLQFLVYVHLVGVTLLASYRAGLKIALWHSLLFFATFYAQSAGLLEPASKSLVLEIAGREFDRMAVFNVVAFWMVAISTATFSSLNERELRRRKADLEALARMAADVENVRSPSEVAQVLLDGITDALAFRRGAVIGVRGETASLLAGSGLGRAREVGPEIDPLLQKVLQDRRVKLVREVDSTANPQISKLLPNSRNLIFAPLSVDGESLGVLVLERSGGIRTMMERRALGMISQFCTQASLALRNAWLLEQIERMAQTDPLTGVANRRTFETVLERELLRARRNGEQVTLVMIDVDHFKAFNDEYGHQAGDAALRKVAGALVEASRGFDTVARYGGEEFAVILPSCSPEESLVAAERLRTALELIDSVVPIAASAGVASFPENAADADELIRAADDALYESKGAGRNRLTRSRRRAGIDDLAVEVPATALPSAEASPVPVVSGEEHRPGAEPEDGPRKSGRISRLRQAMPWLDSIVTMPSGFLARARWLFLVLALINVVALVPFIAVRAAAGKPVGTIMGTAALAWISWWWVTGYRRKNFSPVWIPVEGLSLVTIVGLAVGDPIHGAGLIYVGHCLRSLYGSRRSVIIGGSTYLGALLLTEFMAQDVVGGLLLLKVLGFATAAGMMHALVVSVTKQEHAVAREKALAKASVDLLTVHDRERVCELGAAVVSELTNDRSAEAWVALCSDQALVVATSVQMSGKATTRAVAPAVFSRLVAESVDGKRSATLTRDMAPALWHALDLDPDLPECLLVPLSVSPDTPGAVIVCSERPIDPETRESVETLATKLMLAVDRVSLSVALRGSEDHFRSLVQDSTEAIAVVDADGTIRYQTSSIQRILGWTAAELEETKWMNLLHPEDLPLVETFLDEHIDRPGSTASRRWRMRAHDGTFSHVETVSKNLLHDPVVRGLVLTTRDISDRMELEAQLAYHAYYDPLTDLVNRVQLSRHIEENVRPQGDSIRMGLLFFDLNDFSSINDSLGHAGGDELLVAVADRLREWFPTALTLARIGGDEFGILLDGIAGRKEAVRAADRVIEALRAPFHVVGKEVFVRAGVGVALAAGDSVDVEQLLGNANFAMHMAKTHGGYQIFEPSQHMMAIENLQLKADLQKAVEREEFVLHFQPTFDLDSGRVAGMEALIRWNHPERGLLSPNEFIHLAEQTGLIVPMGAWALREACRRAAQWHEAYPDNGVWAINVNLSGGQLLEPELVWEVRNALEKSRLDPNSLVLEITESVLMHDTEQTIRRFEELKSLGIRLAIDDFGTGYSSLSYLRRFPVDILKIAKPFVDGLSNGCEDSALAEAIIKISESLNLTNIAEGIEHHEQAEKLRSLGCTLGQGFFFSKPLDPEAMEALLKAMPVGGESDLSAA